MLLVQGKVAGFGNPSYFPEARHCVFAAECLCPLSRLSMCLHSLSAHKCVLSPASHRGCAPSWRPGPEVHVGFQKGPRASCGYGSVRGGGVVPMGTTLLRAWHTHTLCHPHSSPPLPPCSARDQDIGTACEGATAPPRPAVSTGAPLCCASAQASFPAVVTGRAVAEGDTGPYAAHLGSRDADSRGTRLSLGEQPGLLV